MSDVSWTSIVIAVSAIIGLKLYLLFKFCCPRRYERLRGYCRDVFDLKETGGKEKDIEKGRTKNSDEGLQHGNVVRRRRINKGGIPAESTVIHIDEDDKGDGVQLTSHHQQQSPDMVIRKYLEDWQRKVCKSLNRFTPPTWNTKHEIDIAEVFTDLVLKEKKGDKTSERSITLQELLRLVQSQRTCKVFVEGKGGMGKSTLLIHLAYCWANEKDDHFPGKLLFLVNLRDLKKDDDVLDVIVRQLNIKDFCRRTKLTKDMIEDFLMKHDDDIVLLLDGYDEVEESVEDPVSLFERKTFENSQVILASRPENVDKIVQKCDRHVSVEGFNPGNIKCYIQKYFQSVEKPELGDFLVKELGLDSTDMVIRDSKHYNAFEMCKSPMLLLKICTMWKEKQNLPLNMSYLFKELFRCILNQFINRGQVKSPITRFEDIPEKYVNAMSDLGRCMYKGLQKNRLSIDKKDLKQNVSVLELGFVYKEENIVEDDFNEIFTTPHKLISESLAGFYLSRKANENYFEGDEIEILRSNQYLRMVREFAVGFLGTNAEKLLKYMITNSPSSYAFPIAQLDYVKEEDRETVMKSLDEHLSHRSPEIKPHFKRISDSLRRFLYHTNPTIAAKSKSENLVQLIRKILCIHNIEEVVREWFETVLNDIPHEDSGKLLAHVLIAVIRQPDLIKEVVEFMNNDIIRSLSGEFDQLQFGYNVSDLDLANKTISCTILSHILNYSSPLTTLIISNCNVSGSMLQEVINRGLLAVKLVKMEWLCLSNNNLSTINVTSLASLLQMAPNLNIKLFNCQLSGIMLKHLISECDRKCVSFKRRKLYVNYNNLSDIDGATFVRVFPLFSEAVAPVEENVFQCISSNPKPLPGAIDGPQSRSLVHLSGNSASLSDISRYYKWFSKTTFDLKFKWSIYQLNAGNLNDLIHECTVHSCYLELTQLELSTIDLSTINGVTLACLFKICPTLKYLGMSYCQLSGNTVKDMLNECNRKGLDLKQNLLCLQLDGNNLSDIDGASLHKLLELGGLRCMKWKDFTLTCSNLKDLIHEGLKLCINFSVDSLDLDGCNMSKLSGGEFLLLLKGLPNLNALSMSDCMLSADIFPAAVKMCKDTGFVSTLPTLCVSRNNLSKLNGKLVTSIPDVFTQLKCVKMSGCNLSSDIFHDIANVCPNTGSLLPLTDLDISDNDLGDLKVASVISLSTITPKLEYLNVSGCNISSQLLQDVANGFSGRSALGLIGLDLSNNDLHDLSAKLLFTICITSPKLENLRMSNCSLSCKTVNTFLRTDSEFKNKIVALDLSSNDLSKIDAQTFALSFTTFKRLHHFDLMSCKLLPETIDFLTNQLRLNLIPSENLFSIATEGSIGFNLPQPWCLLCNNVSVNHGMYLH